MMFWQISPGEWDSDLWPEFSKEGIIAIGFDVGDLRKYTKIKLEQKIRKKLNKGRNTVNSCWDFCHKIMPGDIIITKKGSSKELYGIGVATSEYEFDAKREDYQHIIHVNWIINFENRVELEIDKNFVQYALGTLSNKKYDQIKNSLIKQNSKIKEKIEELEKLSEEIKMKVNEPKQPAKKSQISDDEFEDQLNEFRNKGQIRFITFHPSYSYEEFVEGITVKTDGDSDKNSGEICYVRKPGIFKRICTDALAKAIDTTTDSTNQWEDNWNKVYTEYSMIANSQSSSVNDIWEKAEDFVLIIDEINRGDVSKIFGELVTLLENDKRLGQKNEIVVQLPYSNDSFGVPPNVHIIGTMNTADRSIALVDIALRRRFGFVEMAPDFNLLKNQYVNENKETLEQNGVYDHLLNSIKAIEKINANIRKNLGRDKQVGHSFFFKVNDPQSLMMVWQYEILPLLEEYYSCDYKKILETLELKTDNKYLNQDDGIKGFKTIEELNEFLLQVLKVPGSEND